MPNAAYASSWTVASTITPVLVKSVDAALEVEFQRTLQQRAGPSAGAPSRPGSTATAGISRKVDARQRRDPVKPRSFELNA